MTEDLTGTWDMAAWYNEDADGVRHCPLGQEATGLISYTPDGHVFVSLSAADRVPFALNDPFGGENPENSAAMMSHITYSGRYSQIDGDVVHHMAHAPRPNWIGSKKRRHVDLNADRSLTLGAASATFNGKEVTAYVHWNRADDVVTV